MSLTKARELAVLSIVVAHPVHGYQIASAFEEGPLVLLGLKRAAVYAILSRFEKRGWIVEKEEQGGAYPDRRVCYVTEAGRAAIDDLVEAGGGLAQTPLMSLMLLHDSGVDVTAPARTQLAQRKAMMAELSDDDGAHADTMSHGLAIATLGAEEKVLERLLGAE
jgi:DNA-binding PadR family transcriptional regulator